MDEETRNSLVPILEKISKTLESENISTTKMFEDVAVDEKVKKLMIKSNIIDSSWNELIKAKAIVNPSSYIAERARAIKAANTGIAGEVETYWKELNEEKVNRLPDNKIKALLERKLLTSASDYYAEINMRYPINNLATSLQNAITSSTMNPTERVTKSKRKRKK